MNDKAMKLERTLLSIIRLGWLDNKHLEALYFRLLNWGGRYNIDPEAVIPKVINIRVNVTIGHKVIVDIL